jgi:hypothetical protein
MVRYMIQLSSGQALSCFQPSSAPVNALIRSTFIGVADASTQTSDFSVMRDAVITDVTSDDALTSGGFEVYDVSHGERTSLGINNLESYHVSNTTRNPPRLAFYAGVIYRLIQSVAGNA